MLLAVSVLVAMALGAWSGNQLRFPDEVDYVALAQHLLAGDGYVNDAMVPTAYRPPGFPLWITPWLALPGGILLVKLLNALMLGAALWFMHQIVRSQAPSVAWLAGAGALCYPVWLYTCSTLYPQILCLTLVMAMTWMVVHMDGTQVRVATTVGLGMLAGVMALNMPTFVPLAGLLAWHVHGSRVRQGRPGLPGVVHLFLGMACVVSPWVVRNWLEMGALVPISTNSGINLAMGNNPLAGPNTGTGLPIDYFLAQLPPGTPEVEENQILLRMGRDWILTHPGQAAWLYVQKWVNFFNFQAKLATEQGNAGMQDILMACTYYPMLMLVAARCWWLRQVPLSRLERFCGLTYLCASLLMAVFFTRLRFRLPFDGLLMVWALISLGLLREHGWGRARKMVA